MLYRYTLSLLFILSFLLSVFAADDDKMVIAPKGSGSFEIGQIGRGYFKGGSSQFNSLISHVWQQKAIASVGLLATYKEFLTIDITGEGFMAFSNPQNAKYPTTMQPRNFYYIKSSNACISLGDPATFSGNFQVGYFPYKYNPDVRNLGEYLFRSTPYPMVIYADFDYPQATLLGLRANASLFDSLLINDLLMYSETVAHPVQNWSIADIFSLKIKNFASIGGGIMFYHPNMLSVYQGKNIPGAVDPYYFPENLSANERSGIDTTIEFQATNLMGRFSFDAKQLFKSASLFPAELFGDNDLKLYGEVALLGNKNYPIYYKDMKARTIWTFGFNIPAFKYIDLVNVEFEYCENHSAFSDAAFFSDKPSLLPSALGIDPTSIDNSPLKRSPWRWSVYLKKSLFNNHFGMIAQFARDHKKINFYEFDKAFMSFQEPLITNKDWWWAFKTEFKF